MAIETRFSEVRQRAEEADSVTFFRLDAQDVVLVWESSAEYERLREKGTDTEYRAIIGFGSDKFDPDFGLWLFQESVTVDMSHLANSIWDHLAFLGDRYERKRIGIQEN